MVDSINKNNQGVLLHSILTSELAHGQSSQTTQTVSPNPTTTNLEGCCGTFSLPVVARALSSMTSSMPFIFIPSVSASKTAVSLMRPSLTSPVSQSQAPVTANAVVTESQTDSPSMTPIPQFSSAPSVEVSTLSPGSGVRCAAVLPIRPSPAKGAHKASFLPILPKFRSRRLPKSRTLRQSRRKRSPTPTDAEVREKVMAILDRMKEIEAKQRKEKEDAINARIGGIKCAAKTSRAASDKSSESHVVQEIIPNSLETSEFPRLEPISPASSVEATPSPLIENNVTRDEPALKVEECLPQCTSPFQEQSVDRTPSPCVSQTSFVPNNLDTNFSTQSLENASSMLSNGILIRRCTCSRTGCLKLYCDCFAAGQRCSDCCCFGCLNNSEHEELRQKAIDRIVTRKPDAFLSKIEYSSENESVHTRGCNCKRSSCVKNYCECYEARIRCTSRCRCQSCFNTESWAALTPPANQSKPGIRPRSGSSYTSCSTDHLLTTAGCNNTENYNGSITSGLTTAAIDDGRASASSPSTTTNDLDALSAMLVDPSDSPGLVEDTTTLSVDGRLPSDQSNVKLDMDERVAPTIVSVGSSGASGSSTPPSSTSSVLPSPAVEIRGLTQPVLTSQLIQPPILSAPTSATLMTAAIPPINPMDRIWQAVSQATGHHASLPSCNPLVGLQLPTGPGATLVGVNGLAPSSSHPAISPPVQSTTTVLGYPGDASNLLATYLVALLSGQSQVVLPPTQPTPAYFNPANITSVSPSAILLNCPTAPISPTVLTDDTRGINTTNRATNNSASSIGPNVTHPMPTSEPGVLKNTVPCTLAPAPTSVRLATTTTIAAMRPVPDTAKPEINTVGVISVPVEGSRLNGDDQYTAEELATFERLLQQRCRGEPKANPINTAVSRTDECHQTPIKAEQLDTVSDLETAPPPTLDRSRKSHLSPVHRLNAEVVHLRRQIFRLTRTVRSQDRSIRALQRTIRQLWMSDSALSR